MPNSNLLDLGFVHFLQNLTFLNYLDTYAIGKCHCSPPKDNELVDLEGDTGLKRVGLTHGDFPTVGFFGDISCAMLCFLIFFSSFAHLNIYNAFQHLNC